MEYKQLLDLDQTVTKKFFENKTYPWEALQEINYFFENPQLFYNLLEYNLYNGNIIISKTIPIDVDKTTFKGPIFIDHNALISQNAQISENTIIGKNCVIGSFVEVKNSILFNESKVPHLNYVGNSILGYKAHIGAGVKLANLRLDNKNIKIYDDNIKIDTNMRKFGSIIGNDSHIGCNSVLNPGTIIYPNVIIGALENVKGVVKQRKK